MRAVYQFISYLFFPGTLAIAGFWLILLAQDRQPSLELLWFPTAMFLVAPVLVLLLLVKTGVVSDIHVTDRKQRIMSYPIAIAFGLLFLFLNPDSSWLVRHWSQAVVFTLCGLLLVNLFFLKASAHMAGATGFFFLCLLLYRYGGPLSWLLVSVGIMALVYAARKGLSAHSHLELWAGFCLGFIVTFVTFAI